MKSRLRNLFARFSSRGTFIPLYEATFFLRIGIDNVFGESTIYELSADSTLSASTGRLAAKIARKESLSLKLALRPDRQELINRNILQLQTDNERQETKEAIGAKLIRWGNYSAVFQTASAWLHRKYEDFEHAVVSSVFSKLPSGWRIGTNQSYSSNLKLRLTNNPHRGISRDPLVSQGS